MLETGKTNRNKGSLHSFLDNGSSILAVAHCDFVENGQHFDYAELEKETLIFSPMLDDRLGVYTILDLLPRMGVTTDILLTDNEETGRSTASDFIASKQYNWIVSFDRRGVDAVVYDYDEMHEAVKKHFCSGIGTFSDISNLEHCKAGAFNVGIGYHGEHTSRCFASTSEYFEQIARFLNFWDEFKDVSFSHEPAAYPTYPDTGYWWSRRFRDDDIDVSAAIKGKPQKQQFPDWECPYCFSEFNEEDTMMASPTTIYCPECGHEFDPIQAEDGMANEI